MKNAKQMKITLGIGALGIGLIAGFAPQASAQSRPAVRHDRQEVRKAQQNVREQKRDVQRANTPAQRAKQRDQLRDARGNLRDQKQDLNKTLTRRNDSRVNNRYVPNTRYNGNTRYSANRTLEGVVTSDFRGNGFAFRASNGQQFTVQVRGGEPRGISRGDRVRVYGSSNNSIFQAQNITIVRNR